jgi:hypothetical protein
MAWSRLKELLFPHSADAELVADLGYVGAVEVYFYEF